MKVESPNGKEYYLHSTTSKNRRIAYYFSKDPEGTIEKPFNMEVGFAKNGMPFLRKKNKKATIYPDKFGHKQAKDYK